MGHLVKLDDVGCFVLAEWYTIKGDCAWLWMSDGDIKDKRPRKIWGKKPKSQAENSAAIPRKPQKKRLNVSRRLRQRDSPEYADESKQQ